MSAGRGVGERSICVRDNWLPDSLSSVSRQPPLRDIKSTGCCAVRAHPCREVSDHLFRDSPHSFRPVDVEEGGRGVGGAVGGYKS